MIRMKCLKVSIFLSFCNLKLFYDRGFNRLLTVLVWNISFLSGKQIAENYHSLNISFESFDQLYSCLDAWTLFEPAPIHFLLLYPILIRTHTQFRRVNITLLPRRLPLSNMGGCRDHSLTFQLNLNVSGDYRGTWAVELNLPQFHIVEHTEMGTRKILNFSRCKGI